MFGRVRFAGRNEKQHTHTVAQQIPATNQPHRRVADTHRIPMPSDAVDWREYLSVCQQSCARGEENDIGPESQQLICNIAGRVEGGV